MNDKMIKIDLDKIITVADIKLLIQGLSGKDIWIGPSNHVYVDLLSYKKD